MMLDTVKVQFLHIELKLDAKLYVRCGKMKPNFGISASVLRTKNKTSEFPEGIFSVNNSLL